MTVKPDRWIRKMALEHRMIEPFADRQVRDGVISFGLSSYGYDIRVADEFRIFTNVNSTIVDPKHFDARSFVEFKGEDRKSTRLNSSHGSISYAVFCLKKKNSNIMNIC